MKVQVVKVTGQDQVQAERQAKAVAQDAGQKVIGTYVVRVTSTTVNVAVVTE